MTEDTADLLPEVCPWCGNREVEDTTPMGASEPRISCLGVGGCGRDWAPGDAPDPESPSEPQHEMPLSDLTRPGTLWPVDNHIFLVLDEGPPGKHVLQRVGHMAGGHMEIPSAMVEKITEIRKRTEWRPPRET